MEGVGYVTTIHAIVSGLIKLSKIGVIVGRAYRGIHGKSIPSCFLLPGSSPNRQSVTDQPDVFMSLCATSVLYAC